MKKQDLIDNNILIAEFMGYQNNPIVGTTHHPFKSGTDKEEISFLYRNNPKYEIPSKKNPVFPSELLFASSWDWLMPVAKMVKKVTWDADLRVKGSLGDSIKSVKLYTDIFRSFHDVDVAITYEAIVEFIKWYNENK